MCLCLCLCLCNMFVQGMGECGESDCIAATGIPSVRCAESPAILSGCVTRYDTLYWALVDREDLQPIAIRTIDAQETPSSPESVWRESKGRGLGDRSHSLSVDFSLTNCKSKRARLAQDPRVRFLSAIGQRRKHALEAGMEGRRRWALTEASIGGMGGKECHAWGVCGQEKTHDRVQRIAEKLNHGY
jgi:hypothetical protein